MQPTVLEYVDQDLVTVKSQDNKLLYSHTGSMGQYIYTLHIGSRQRTIGFMSVSGRFVKEAHVYYILDTYLTTT